MTHEKLFEGLDEKIFTPELKDKLNESFETAVQDKVQVLHEELLEENEQTLQTLKENLGTEYEEKNTELVENIGKYLDKAIQDFIAETEDVLVEQTQDAKSAMVLEAVESALISASVETRRITEAKDDTDASVKLKEMTRKYDALMNENMELQNENQQIVQMGVINEMSENLSLVQTDKFKKLAEMVPFSRDAEYVEKLKTIAESITEGTVDSEQTNRLSESTLHSAHTMQTQTKKTKDGKHTLNYSHLV